MRAGRSQIEMDKALLWVLDTERRRCAFAAILLMACFAPFAWWSSGIYSLPGSVLGLVLILAIVAVTCIILPAAPMEWSVIIYPVFYSCFITSFAIRQGRNMLSLEAMLLLATIVGLIIVSSLIGVKVHRKAATWWKKRLEY